MKEEKIASLIVAYYTVKYKSSICKENAILSILTFRGENGTGRK
jgi:hypothetical protein